MQVLRVLVVLPMYGGSLPIGRYCAHALSDIGQSVRVFDAPALFQAFTGLRTLDLTPARQARLENEFLEFVSTAIWSQAEEFLPHLVLALAQAPMSARLLARMRKAKMRTVMWFVEDYRVFAYWQNYAPLYDAFAVIQKEPFLEKLKNIGQEHAFYLPLAALPSFHKPLELSSKERKLYGSDLAFLGAGYPNRRKAFRPLADRDFKIWGSDWDGEKALGGNIQRNGERIGEEESVRIYNAAKINLNLHSSLDGDQIVSHGDFVNPRTFELAAMGAFQIVDRRSLMGELFSEDELYAVDSGPELYAAIEHFLNFPEERALYARRARERALRDHTYAQRMLKLLKYMENEFGPWENLNEAPEALAEVPEELRTELCHLLERLGLPASASFEDLSARLRRQSGALSDLETSLLFLDEWRKQYKR